MARRIVDHALQAALEVLGKPAHAPTQPRMDRGSSNLADGSKPAVGVAHIQASKEPPRQPSALGLVVEESLSADEMIACLGSCRTRSEIAAMIKALSLHPWLNTPAETKRLEAARAAMENWKSYSHACQARHNAHRLRLSHR